jgi:hypothetical protein
MNPHGRILPRVDSGNCAKHQRKIAHAIKKAVHMGFFTYKSSQFQIKAPYLPEDMATFAGPQASGVDNVEMDDILRSRDEEEAFDAEEEEVLKEIEDRRYTSRGRDDDYDDEDDDVGGDYDDEGETVIPSRVLRKRVKAKVEAPK